MKSKSIKKNVAWMFLGNSIYALSLWLQLLIVAKYSSAWTLGTYTLAMAVTAPVFMLMGLQLRTIQVTDADGRFLFSDFLILRSITNCLAVFFTIALVLFSGDIKTGFGVFFGVALIKSLEGLSEVFNSRQQLNENMEYVALSFSCKGLSGVVAMYFGVCILGDILWALALQASLYVVVLVFVDLHNSDVHGGNVARRELMDGRRNRVFMIVRLGIPLGCVLLLASISTNLPKYIIDFHLGRDAQGVFSTLAYFIVIGNFVISAMGQVFVPRLSKYYTAKRIVEFSRLANLFSLACFLCGAIGVIVAYLFGERVLSIFVDERFSEFSDVLIFVMIAGLCSYVSSSFGYIMTAMKLFSVQPWINAIGLIVGGAASYAFVIKYGLLGACYGIAVTFVLQGLISRTVIFLNIKHKKEVGW